MPVAHPSQPIRLLIASLSSTDPSVRSAAAWELAGTTELRDEASVALWPLQTDPDRDVRYAAAWALGHLAPPSPSHAPLAPGEQPPKPIHFAKPEYPRAAFDAKTQGTVIVEILVGEQGEVAHLEIRESIPELDDAALASVRQWRFQPARRNGAPHATVALVPIRFRFY